MTDAIRIVEVGPRDGLQNEQVPIPTEEKLAFITRLVAAGLREIEVSSFVSPKWVPQLGDVEALWPRLPEGPLYSALVPNAKGLERALALGVKRIALFTAASETFTRKNINMSIDESLEVAGNVIREFRSAVPDGFVRGYVSMVIECPYEGLIEASKVIRVAEQLLELGADEVSLGETIGVASPLEVNELCEQLVRQIPVERTAWHFHDTRGTGIANVSAAMDFGYSSFDSSAGGLGGCPYAKGAGGNIATEDLVYLAKRSGLALDVDLDALARASLPLLERLGRGVSAKAQLAVLS